jgi:hypothetical protein
MIHPTLQDAGRRVSYLPYPGAEPEMGDIVLFNAGGEPFVLFDGDTTPKLTFSRDLSWADRDLDPGALYLVRKRNGGPYWRENRRGYTTSKAEAGRYSLAEARACVSMTSEMLAESEGPDFTGRRLPARSLTSHQGDAE